MKYIAYEILSVQYTLVVKIVRGRSPSANWMGLKRTASDTARTRAPSEIRIANVNAE